jgi:hypothetical protein
MHAVAQLVQALRYKPEYAVAQLVQALRYKPGHTVVQLIQALRYKPGHAVAQVVQALRYKLKVMGSIPDGVTGIFQGHNPTSHTKAMGTTQPLTEMSTRNIS